MTCLYWAALLPAICCLATQASAHQIDDPTLMVRVGGDELAQQRGGFRVGSLDISLGAEIRSYVGDTLVMQTNISWTDVATKVQRTFSAGLSQNAATGLASGLLEGGDLKIGLSNQAVFLANQGRTAFVQRTDGTIQNIIVNTASNVDLRQDVDVRIDIAGFASARTNVVTARIASALSSLTGLARWSSRLN